MTRGTRALQRIGAGLVLLAAPALVFAGRYQPEPKWLEAVRAPQAFVPYRLGVVEFKNGLSDEWLEYLGDFRATLRGANYFQQTEAPRLRVEIERGYRQGSSDEDGCKETPGTLALTYRFLDGEREVSRLSVTTQAPVDGDSNDWHAAMAGNLKFLLLEMRKGQGDEKFAQVAGGIEARIREQLGKGSSTGCIVGAVLTRGFMAAAEGTVAVIGGLGEVAGLALEVAASPQFQGAVNTALAEQQQQQRQQPQPRPQPQQQQQAQQPQPQQQQAQQQQQQLPQQRPQGMAVASNRPNLPAPASNPSASQTSTASPAARPAPAAAAVQSPSAPAPGLPLRFVMSIALRNLPGDKVNPSCYSNIITRPGPPGWGGPGWLPQGSAEQAREAVYSMKSAFIARCRASGREIIGEGSFNFQMNQSRGDDQRLQEIRPRYSEDVSVTM